MRENTLNPRVIADVTEKLVGGWWDENGDCLLEVIKLLLADYGGAVCARQDFKTEEEAKKAVEKLKALKRLGDHNLRIGRGKRTFVNTDVQLTHQVAMFTVDTYDKVEEDLDLLFPKGGDRWTGKLLD